MEAHQGIEDGDETHNSELRAGRHSHRRLALSQVKLAGRQQDPLAGESSGSRDTVSWGREGIGGGPQRQLEGRRRTRLPAHTGLNLLPLEVAAQWEQDLAEALRRAGYMVSMRFDMSRVLVIDNDPDTRSLVGILLRNKGIETDAAEHGGEGLAKARQNPPDLILCDLDMPVMDGMETLAEIRRDPLLRSIPFVLITAVATEAEERSMVRGGASGILRKPFAFASLLEIVQTHLDRPKGNPPGA